MEKEGLRRSLDRLEESGVKLDCIVTDRHPQIQKFLKDRKIFHYYDVWHMAKGNACILLDKIHFRYSWLEVSIHTSEETYCINLFQSVICFACKCFTSLGLSKKVEKISREKDCSLVKKWHKSITNHLYWSATSSDSGPEKLAKWTSIINHIQDIHTHSDPAFPRCQHEKKLSKDRSKWFQPGV